MKKVLYCYTSLSSFVEKDIRLLSENYSLKQFQFDTSPKSKTPFSFIKQFLFLLFNLGKADIVICQFSGYHSYLPTLLAKLFKKPSLIVAGGTDCVSFPSIQYGNFYKKGLAWFTGRSYKLATHIAPVHQSLIDYEYSYQPNDFVRQGYKNYVKNITTPATVIENGYDAYVWKPVGSRITNRLITVCAGINKRFTKQLKGLDLILEAAKSFPELEFVVIGVPNDHDLGYKGSNLITKEFVPNKELPKEFAAASYYLQLSISEGFPNGLCEAMLCGCVPIVSNVGGMPDIVDGIGAIIKRRDVGLLKNILETLPLSNFNEESSIARKRIEENFSEVKRKEKLNKLIDDLIS